MESLDPIQHRRSRRPLHRLVPDGVIGPSHRAIVDRADLVPLVDARQGARTEVRAGAATSGCCRLLTEGALHHAHGDLLQKCDPPRGSYPSSWNSGSSPLLLEWPDARRGQGRVCDPQQK